MSGRVFRSSLRISPPQSIPAVDRAVLGRWLPVTAVLFGVSAAAFASANGRCVDSVVYLTTQPNRRVRREPAADEPHGLTRER